VGPRRRLHLAERLGHALLEKFFSHPDRLEISEMLPLTARLELK
jgi:hypothetical protein